MLSLDELMPDREELEALEQSAPDSPEHSVLREEEAERVREAVLRIPPQYRLILVLHDMEELSTEEVARITGLTENTIRVRLHRARLFVRKELANGREMKALGLREKLPARRMAEIGRKVAAKCLPLFRTISTKRWMIRSVPNWRSTCPGACLARRLCRI